ncbi:MAG TPA: methionyl-tRNA formyltransferase [Balneolaceae bacterium]|nr:methionyl-tRNA formyltransferase [Balneolaceae bacterium]
MKIVFMGSPDFALPSLEKLHASAHEISAVVSGKDKRRGRRSRPTPTPVKAKARELGLPVIEVEDLTSLSFAEKLKSLSPDLFVVVAFRILPSSVLKIPSIGAINLHASLLPKYRGAAPIHWAVMNGETETGCTIFWLDKNVDTGQIMCQRSTPIGENETTGEVYERLKEMGGELLAEAVESIEDDSFTLRKQNDEEATRAPKIFSEDCKLNFDKPAIQVHNKIRGLSPIPTAWAKLDGLRLNIYRSRVGPDKNLPPGTLRMYKDDLLAGCAEGTVILDTVQLEGKRKMSGKDFMNGYNGPGLLH